MVKTATKTAKPSPRNGNVLPLGNHPGNTGGKKGRSGRKPLEITIAAQHAVTDHDLIGMAVRIAMKASRDSDRLAAIRFLVERGWGQSAQVVEHTGEVLNVHEHRQAFESRMDRLTSRLGAAALPEWPE